MSRRVEAMYGVVRGQRGAGDIQVLVRAHGQVEGRHARRQGGKGLGTSAIGPDTVQRAGTIADEQRPVGRKRQPTGHAEFAGKHLVPSVLEQAIDAAVVAARDVEVAGRRHRQAGGVHDAVGLHLASALAADAIDGHRRVLAPRSAERRIQPALAVEHRAVHVMQAGGERLAHLHEQGRARRPCGAHRRAARRRRRWHFDGQAIGCGEHDPRPCATHRHHSVGRGH